MSFYLLCIIKARAHSAQTFSPWPPAHLHVSLIWCVYPVSHSVTEVLFSSKLWTAPLVCRATTSHTHCTFNITRWFNIIL